MTETTLSNPDDEAKRGGRPALINPELIENVAARIRATHTIKDACLLEGVAESTFMRWLARGRREPETLYGTLLAKIDSAKADARVSLIEIVAAAAGIGLQPGHERPSRVRRQVTQYGDGSQVVQVTEEREPARWAHEMLKSRYPEDWGRLVIEQSQQQDPLRVVFVPSGKDEE